MKRFLSKFVVMAFVATFILSTAATVSTNAQAPTAWEEQVFTLVNTQRVQNNLQPLIWCNFLAQAARTHSTDLATNVPTDNWGHVGSDGSSVEQRINRVIPSGITHLYTTVAENIARAHATPEATVQHWMNTAVHRNSILNPALTHAAVGFHTTGQHTTQVFGGGRTAGVIGEQPNIGRPPLTAPVISINGSVISWPAVFGAVHYDIFVNNQARDMTQALNFDLATLNLTGGVTLPVHVVASNADRTLTGSASNTVNFIPQPVLPPYNPVINTVTGRITFEGRQYQVFDTGFTWQQAYDHAYYLGGHLAVITSNAQQQFIAGLLQSGSRNYYWLGGRRIANSGENQFEWITSANMTFTNWAPGQPSRQHLERGGANRMAIRRSDSRWLDLLLDGIPVDNGGWERRNIGFIVEWPPEAIEEDGPSVATITVAPASVTVGESATISASGIADAVRAEFITRTAAGAEVIIHSVQNPGSIITHSFVTTNPNITQVIVRVHDADGLHTQRSANIDIQPVEGDPAPEPAPDPAPTPDIPTTVEPAPMPTVPVRPAPQFREQPTVTDIGVLLEWNSVLGNQFGFMVFRAETATGDGIAISDLPIMGQNHFRPGSSVTFDPNARPGMAYYYYIREIMDLSAGTMGPPSERVRVVTPAIPSSAVNRGFMLMVVGNPWLNANNAWEQIDPGVGTSPMIDGGRTMVPIRAVVENMYGVVGWNAAESRVELSALGNQVHLWLGRTDIIVNGNPGQMDIAPTVVNDRTLLPLRFAAESLGTQVDWIAGQQMIVIVYPR